MNFRRKSFGLRDEPEINLIPFIDVLLVILIFLMLTTTYNKFTEMQLRLPVADTEAQRDHPNEIVIAVSSDGTYMVNKKPVAALGAEALASALLAAARDRQEAVLIISADATARHQSVITVMEAARRAGLTHITFATQSSTRASAR
ncbi:MAG: ExbD/TolR family protein [Hylemonella sp.]